MLGLWTTAQHIITQKTSYHAFAATFIFSQKYIEWKNWKYVLSLINFRGKPTDFTESEVTILFQQYTMSLIDSGKEMVCQFSGLGNVLNEDSQLNSKDKNRTLSATPDCHSVCFCFLFSYHLWETIKRAISKAVEYFSWVNLRLHLSFSYLVLVYCKLYLIVCLILSMLFAR